METPPLPRPEWIAQPDGLTCGPACMAMLHAAVALRHGIPPLGDVPAIAAMCGTDETSGTTHEGIAVAARGLGLSMRRHLGIEAFERAWREARDDGGALLLRTLTRGIPHWIVAFPTGTGADVLDPWLGKLALDRDAIERLVSPRDHETWTVDASIRPRTLRMLPAAHFHQEVIEVMAGEFQRLMEGDLGAYLDEVVDWELSQALLVDDRVVGAYLLAERDPDSLPGVEVPDDLRGLRAVEGVALATVDAERGNGYGRLLRHLPGAMGFEMVWGQQHKALGNLEPWLRHRRLIGDTGESWVTARALHPEMDLAPRP